jgi:hypothetical protein
VRQRALHDMPGGGQVGAPRLFPAGLA